MRRAFELGFYHGERLPTLPASFFAPSVQLPKAPWRIDFSQERERFLTHYKNLQSQELSGQTNSDTVLQVILSAWVLRKHYGTVKDGDLQKLVMSVEDIARRYGMMRVWRSGYYETLLERADLEIESWRGNPTKKCSKCGRTIWAVESVRVGLGSWCRQHKGAKQK